MPSNYDSYESAYQQALNDLQDYLSKTSSPAQDMRRIEADLRAVPTGSAGITSSGNASSNSVYGLKQAAINAGVNSNALRAAAIASANQNQTSPMVGYSVGANLPNNTSVNYSNMRSPAYGNSTVQDVGLGTKPFNADVYFGGDVAATPAGRQYGVNIGSPVGKGYFDAYGNYVPNQKDYEVGVQYSTPFKSGGPVRFDGGGPVVSPMGDTFISQPDQDYSQVPGYATVADVQDAIAKAGSAVGEPAKEAAQNYLDNVSRSFQEGQELVRESGRSITGKGGRLAINAPAQYLLGTTGMLTAPVNGALSSFGDAVTQLTGNPEIGQRASIVAGLLGPTELNAAKELAIASKSNKVVPAIDEGLKGIEYVTSQDGPYYRVSSRNTERAGQSDSRAGEGLGSENGGSSASDGSGSGSAGSRADESLSDAALKEIISDPNKNVPLQIANQYTVDLTGKPFTKIDMPPSSLEKQGAIARVHQEAIKGSPEYKDAVFKAYQEQMPDVVAQAGANNYDDLLKASYDALGKETAAQFDQLPIDMSFHKNGEGNYANSAEMAKDVHGNNHLFVFQGGDPHDFLSDIDPATGLSGNEKFRAVHDYFGHAALGNGFGPKGEETAWGAHQQMYTPLAQLAMTAETRGQNSLVNYSPLNAELQAKINKLDQGATEANRVGDTEKAQQAIDAKKAAYDTWQYAPQKAVLLPPEFTRTDYAGGMPDYMQSIIKPQEGTASEYPLVHYSTDPNLTVTDPSMYGTGIKGLERSRVLKSPTAVKERSYFYTGTPDTVTPEAGLGSYGYTAQGKNLYDIAQDPLNLITLTNEANRTPWSSNFNPGVIDRTQAANDLERLIKQYGYEGMANTKAAYPMAIKFGPTEVQRFAKGGQANVKRDVDNTAHNIPVNTVNVDKVVSAVREVSDIAREENISRNQLSTMIMAASGAYIPKIRANKYAEQILKKDIVGVVNRLRVYPNSVNVLNRLVHILDGKEKLHNEPPFGPRAKKSFGEKHQAMAKDLAAQAMKMPANKAHSKVSKALSKIHSAL